MIDKLINIGHSGKEKWFNFNRVKQVAIILIVISTLAIVGSTIYITTKTDYSVLFSDLSQEDAGTIVDDLESEGVKYKLEEDGTKILIDKNLVDKYRINLAVDNKLPSSSTGFEIFDNTSLMSTDEDRKIMYQRAVTGELERSIETLDAVKKAKVILAIPDKSIFEKKQDQATASIVLTLNKSRVPSASTISGIASLTSGAVEDLPVANIKIVDSDGNVLSDALKSDSSKASTDLISQYQQVKEDYESALEKKINDLLEPTLGTGKVQLSINADLDFDSVEKTTVDYANPEVRSENVQASGGAVDTQEVSGCSTEDNVSNVVGSDAAGDKSYEKSVNNELDTQTTKIVSAPGVVKKISTSVVINENLSQADQQKIEKIVASAVGLDEARGDTISVEGLVLNKKNSNEKNKNLLQSTTGNNLSNKLLLVMILLAAAAVVIIVLLIVLLMYKKRKREKAIDLAYEMADEERSDNEADLLKNDKNEKTQDESMGALAEKKEKNRAEELMSENDKNAKKYAKENPELAAELIKVWMRDK